MRTISLFKVLAFLSAGFAIPFQANAQWPNVMTTPVVQGLAAPVHINNAGDGSARLFIVEQAGRIRIFNNGTLQSTPFLDISQRVRFFGEQGLLSVAFPPNNNPNKGYFYVYYTDLNGNNQVSRFSITANPNVADPASEIPILNFSHPVFTNHNGGQLAFGPDGFLYMGTGDGGGGGDPNDNAQNPASFLGKLLRIDVETAGCVTNPPSVPRNYCVPAANPFFVTPGFLPEIWALGVRNPWRFSFDRTTGNLYIADVGQDRREEVDFQAAGSAGGQNYGWSIFEGSLCFNLPSGCVPPSGYVGPVVEYDHGINDVNGCAIAGGHVYRGADPGLALLLGGYLYGDLCSGKIWGFRQASAENMLLLDTGMAITTFGLDEQGNQYVADYGSGVISLFVQLPAHASRIGVFTSGTWYFDTFSNGAWDGLPNDRSFPDFGKGLPNVMPVVGNWEGTAAGIRVGVFTNGTWYFDMNGNGAWDGPAIDRTFPNFGVGLPNAIPVVGDWDGSGITKIGVYSNGTWYFDMNGNGAWDGPVIDRTFPNFGVGLPNAIPVVGDWDGSGITKIGVYSSGTWYFDMNGNGAWDGPSVDRTFTDFGMGLPNPFPVAGIWP
jgi:glucose/arabinose dehydrogenase